jgi:putative transcriptional regulator
MAVKCNLSLLMGREKYQIQDVHIKTGLSRNTISSLYNEKSTRIDFATIEKLCRLFNCGIEELIEVEIEDESK